MHKVRGFGNAVPWIVFAAALVCLALCLHLNSTGAMDDTHLTIYTSVLSIVLTTVVVVYCILHFSEDNSARYMKLNHPDGKDGGTDRKK